MIDKLVKQHWLLKTVIFGILTALIWLGVNYLVRHICVPKNCGDKCKFRKELLYDSLFTTLIIFLSMCSKDIVFKFLHID